MKKLILPILILLVAVSFGYLGTVKAQSPEGVNITIPWDKFEELLLSMRNFGSGDEVVEPTTLTSGATSASGNVTHPSDSDDDFAIGGTDTNAPFYFDTSAGDLTITGDASVGGDISLTGGLEMNSATITDTLVVGGNATTTGNHVVGGNLTVSGDLNTGPLTFAEDSGAVTWFDMAVSATPAAGTAESYTAKVDGVSLFTVFGEADSAGGLQRQGIGINTTTPYADLAVEMSTQDAMVISNTGSTTPAFIIKGVNQSGRIGINTQAPTSTLQVTGGDVHFQGDNGEQGFYFDSANARVGIGKTSGINSKLHLNGGVQNGLRIGSYSEIGHTVWNSKAYRGWNAYLSRSTDSDSNQFIPYYNSGTAMVEIMQAAGESNIQYWGLDWGGSSTPKDFAVDFTFVMEIDPTGKLGILDATPQYALTVGDGEKFTVDGNGNATSSGYMIVGSTNPSNNMSAGDLLLGGNATTTGDLVISGGDLNKDGTELTIGGNFLLDSNVLSLTGGVADWEFLSGNEVGGTVTLSSRNNITFNADNDSNTNGDLVFQTKGSPIVTFKNDGDALFGGGATVTEAFIIGTTQPTMDMQAGDLLVGNNATTTGAGYYGGDLRVVGTLDSSDIRMDNKFILTEGDKVGLDENNFVVLNQDGKIIVVIDENGNIHNEQIDKMEARLNKLEEDVGRFTAWEEFLGFLDKLFGGLLNK